MKLFFNISTLYIQQISPSNCFIIILLIFNLQISAKIKYKKSNFKNNKIQKRIKFLHNLIINITINN